VETSDLLRDLESNPRHSSFEFRELLALLSVTVFLLELHLLELFQPDFAVLVDVLDSFDSPGPILFGLVFIARELSLFGKGNGVADVDTAVLQVFTDLQHFADGDRRARDRFLSLELTTLDTFRNGDFAFARKQRNNAHLAEVKSNGIVCLFECAGGKV